MRGSRTLRVVAPLLLGAIVAADSTVTLSPGSSANPSEDLYESARRAVALFDEWLQPLASGRLTVVVDRWDSPRAGSYSNGEVIGVSRWLTHPHAHDSERTMIGAIARQYWINAAPPDSSPDAAFAQGVADYLAARAIHTIFLGRHDDSARYFGGFVPYAARALPLSLRPDEALPAVAWFAEFERVRAANAAVTADVVQARRRVAAALFTLERLIGWPELQVALAALSKQPPATRERFAGGLEEVTSRPIVGFVNDALNASTVFDYSIAELVTSASGAEQHPYETRVTVTRGAGRAPDVELAVWFADGAEARERWRGEDLSRTFRFASVAPAVAAQVDAGTTLLLDRDRRNNTRRLARSSDPLVLRSALRWLVWLQQLMLTYGALA